LCNEAFDSSPGTHAAACEASYDVDEGDGRADHCLLVAAHPSSDTVVVARRDSSGWVEAFTWQLTGCLDLDRIICQHDSVKLYVVVSRTFQPR